MAGHSAPSEVQFNVLAWANHMYFLAYVIASGQVTTIHHLLKMSSRMGQPTTLWDEQHFATDINWTDMGIRTVEQPPNIFNRALNDCASISPRGTLVHCRQSTG